MSLRVTVEDIEEGGSETVIVPDGEYFLLTVGSCYVSGTQIYPKAGTVVLTIKGRNPKPAPPPAPAATPHQEADLDT